MARALRSASQEGWSSQASLFIGALAIHLVLGLLLVGFNWRSHQAVIPQLAIHATLVDRNMLNQVAKQVAKPEPKQAEPVKEPEVDKQKELAQQQEQERQKQAQLKQQQLELQQTQEKERRLAAEAQQKQQQEAANKKLADIQQKQREAELKRQADAEAKAQAANEAELKAQLAAEEGRTTAVNAGLLNQYAALIQQKVMRNWIKPPTAKAGLECEVKVVQAMGGTVLSVDVGRCNGDAAVRTSIEQAVQRASPLPAPPDPRLFERNLIFNFKPTE
jgi:colicin import membrane protein